MPYFYGGFCRDTPEQASFNDAALSLRFHNLHHSVRVSAYSRHEGATVESMQRTKYNVDCCEKGAMRRRLPVLDAIVLDLDGIKRALAQRNGDYGRG